MKLKATLKLASANINLAHETLGDKGTSVRYMLALNLRLSELKAHLYGTKVLALNLKCSGLFLMVLGGKAKHFPI